MRALRKQVEGLTDGVGRPHRDRGVVHEVARLHETDDIRNHVERNVLGNDGETATTAERLGHPPA